MSTNTKPRVGLEIPSAATKLLTLARKAGWKYSTSWGVEDSTKLPFYRLTMARPATPGRTYVHAVMTWHTDQDKGHGLELNNRVVRTERGGPWHDMPNLRVLSNMIHAEPTS
jgi:hypothetical protein